VGERAMLKNIDGIQNTAIGSTALINNTSGGANTALGATTLTANTSGFGNTAAGLYGLVSNTIGSENTTIGAAALFHSTTGNQNTAVGGGAFKNNTIGSGNTALGYETNVGSGSLSNATAIGNRAQVDCNDCLVLGSINGINGASSSVKVGIGTANPNASAALEIASTNKGMLIPRMTLSQRDAISSPATGLLVFQTDNTPGFYYYNGSAWNSLVGPSGWSMILQIINL
jgi:trimeric autotransporter adhesin